MPKEAIDLKLFIDRIMKGEIQIDKPLIIHKSDNGIDRYLFQDSGMNVLLGLEGSGKTKFLTIMMIQLLKKIKSNEGIRDGIIYIDTERPESQYASTIGRILEASTLEKSFFIKVFNFFTVAELTPSEIKQALTNFLALNPGKRFIIVIDHILALTSDFNKPSEASEIDLFLKQLISCGHLFIVSIHMPYSGISKGLGHLGSSLQRLASFILEIANSSNNSGFEISQKKSRISRGTDEKLFLKMDSQGNITFENSTIIQGKRKKPKPSPEEMIKLILKEFVDGDYVTKKQLYSIISKKHNWSEDSSSSSTFFKEHMKDLFTFADEGYLLTEKAEFLLQEIAPTGNKKPARAGKEAIPFS